jgi:iron complex outermembrane receptor protein
VAFLLFPLVLAAGLAAAQEPTARIVGTVTDSATGLPLAGVQVTLLGTALSASTSSEGHFEFPGLSAGRYVVHVRTVGYAGATLEATLAEGAVEEFAVGLAAVSVVLPEVVVEGEAQPVMRTAGLQGFYRRVARGHGYFVTREDVQRIRPAATSDLLMAVPGIEVTRQGGNWETSIRSAETPLTLRDGVPAACPVHFYVNGRLSSSDLESGSFNPSSLDSYRPTEIEGIEVYRRRTEIPHEFMRTGASGQPPCAVIIVWTREGPTRR